MVRSILIICFISLPFGLIAQDDTAEDGNGRALGLEFGIRNTYSLFGDLGNVGTGFGGQFRIKPGDRWNTEWYLDHIKTDIDGLGHRQTVHIGWSVMFYLLEPDDRLLEPYLLAGHCFDYAKVRPIDPYAGEGPRPLVQLTSEKERWSSAVQVGAGTHLMLTDRFDLSLSAQYMTHLGNDLSVEKREHQGESYIVPEKKEGSLSLEGHLLTTLSMNLYILPR